MSLAESHFYWRKTWNCTCALFKSYFSVLWSSVGLLYGPPIRDLHFDSNDKASQCRGFYYDFGRKDLQLSPSAKSSTSSLAKSFEVILSERKTPTLVHKPCQALHQCPYVKLILQTTTTLRSHTIIRLLNSIRLGVVKETDDQEDKL